MTCGLNEIYSGCGDDGCQRSCDRLDISGCTSTCGTAACICLDGYVKDSAGNCVPVSDCRMSEFIFPFKQF